MYRKVKVDDPARLSGPSLLSVGNISIDERLEALSRSIELLAVA
jgi:hypothetical protein